MIFHIETIIGDRHESPDSLTNEQVHQWLGRIQKHDILKVETPLTKMISWLKLNKTNFLF